MNCLRHELAYAMNLPSGHELHPRCMINLSRAIDKRFYECYNPLNIRILLGVLI